MKQHNSGAFFSWFRDDEPYACGTDLCFVPVKMPGQYAVHVTGTSADGQSVYICPRVIVTECLDSFQNLITDVEVSSQTSQGRLDGHTPEMLLPVQNSSSISRSGETCQVKLTGFTAGVTAPSYCTEYQN